MKVGDLVTILYESKAFCLIVGNGSTTSTFLVFCPNGSIRVIPKLELKLVT